MEIRDMDDYYNLNGARGVIGIDPFVATDDLPKSDFVDESEFGLIIYETDMKL